MLAIRPEQMAAFAGRREDRFVELAFDVLREIAPRAVEGLVLPQVAPRIRNAVSRARGWGITNDGDVMAFVALVFLVGPSFDAHPAVRAVLGDPLIPSSARMWRLLRDVSDEDWESAGAYA